MLRKTWQRLGEKHAQEESYNFGHGRSSKLVLEKVDAFVLDLQQHVQTYWVQ